jgi:hypothetical protein
MAVAAAKRGDYSWLMIVVDPSGKRNFAFPDKIIQSHFVTAGADRVLFPAPSRGTESGVFFGWHERAAGAYSSQDME